MCHGNEEWCKNWRGIDLLTQNWLGEFDQVWPDDLEISNLHFNGMFLSKVYSVWAKKKCRGVMIDGTDDWCKIWRKINLCFLKWHEEFDKFSFTGWKIAISF